MIPVDSRKTKTRGPTRNKTAATCRKKWTFFLFFSEFEKRKRSANPNFNGCASLSLSLSRPAPHSRASRRRGPIGDGVPRSRATSTYRRRDLTVVTSSAKVSTKPWNLMELDAGKADDAERACHDHVGRPVEPAPPAIAARDLCISRDVSASVVGIETCWDQRAAKSRRERV